MKCENFEILNPWRQQPFAHATRGGKQLNPHSSPPK